MHIPEPPPAARMMKCPFALCRAVPGVRMHQPESQYPEVWHTVILSHDLLNDRVPGKHTCPASLMRWPLSMHDLSVLAQQLPVFLRLMPESVEKEAGRSIDEIIRDQRNRSGPVGGEGRRGRTPVSANDPAWQRGGRQDEDIIPSEPQEGLMSRLPLGISGAGNRGENMASSAIQTAIAYVNGARLSEDNAKGIMREALTTLQGTTAASMAELENAKAGLAAANEIGNSQRLSAAYVAIEASIDKLKEMLGQVNNSIREMESSINAAQQQQDEWIGIVTSA